MSKSVCVTPLTEREYQTIIGEFVSPNDCVYFVPDQHKEIVEMFNTYKRGAEQYNNLAQQIFNPSSDEYLVLLLVFMRYIDKNYENKIDDKYKNAMYIVINNLDISYCGYEISEYEINKIINSGNALAITVTKEILLNLNEIWKLDSNDYTFSADEFLHLFNKEEQNEHD